MNKIFIIKYKQAMFIPGNINIIYAEVPQEVYTDELTFIDRVRELANEKIETLYKNQGLRRNKDIQTFVGDLRELNTEMLLKPIIN